MNTKKKKCKITRDGVVSALMLAPSTILLAVCSIYPFYLDLPVRLL